jgi:hypothetical protein
VFRLANTKISQHEDSTVHPNISAVSWVTKYEKTQITFPELF